MKIRQLFFLFVLLFSFSCQLNTPKNIPNEEKLEITRLQDVNKVLWERILLNPDSVYLHLKGLDLVISGKLNKYGYSPISLKTKLNTGHSFNIKDIYGNWGKGIRYFYIFYEDVNFDGNKDIGFLNNYGATGNYWYTIWIFNEEENKFLFDDYYSEMPSPIIDTLNQEIQTFYRMGACDEVIYVLKKDEVKKRIYTENENTHSGSDCWCITEQLIDGIWKETERRIIYRSLDEIYRTDIPIICGGRVEN